MFNLLDEETSYFDSRLDRAHLLRVAGLCYRPANALIRSLSDRYEERFRIGFSISGTALDQLEAWAPDVIESFRSFARSKAASFLGETYYHSLAGVFSREEFLEQIDMHSERLRALVGAPVDAFRNTELIYRDDLPSLIHGRGFRAILADGIDRILRGRSPNRLYRPPGEKVPVLLRNHRFSDDIAFRFSDRTWEGWPLEPDGFAKRLREAPGDFVNLFMDYETLGEHQRTETGIFSFFEKMIDSFLGSPGTRVVAPCDITAGLSHEEIGRADVFEAETFVSWADEARDLSAWLGNGMQKSAAQALYDLEESVKASGNEILIADWRKLQTSDHFYYMSTKGSADGGVHDYFTPHPSPWDAFAAYMNIVHDLRSRASSNGP